MPTLTRIYLNDNVELPSTLYHYCSTNTLLSIIQNKCIWLSDADKTNDSTEMKWLFFEYKELIEQTLVAYKNKYSEQILFETKRIAFEIIHHFTTFS